MYLAGLRLPDEDVRELIKLVDEPTRSFLEKSVALDIFTPLREDYLMHAAAPSLEAAKAASAVEA